MIVITFEYFVFSNRILVSLYLESFMKYTFRHTAIIEHEVEADNIHEAKKKFFEDIVESPEFFAKASKVVTDERIKVLNKKGHHIDTFNIYDDVD